MNKLLHVCICRYTFIWISLYINICSYTKINTNIYIYIHIYEYVNYFNYQLHVNPFLAYLERSSDFLYIYKINMHIFTYAFYTNTYKCLYKYIHTWELAHFWLIDNDHQIFYPYTKVVRFIIAWLVTYNHAYIYIYVYIYVFISLWLCLYIYMYIYSYTYMNIYMYIHVFIPLIVAWLVLTKMSICKCFHR
jgi:hypothetical protein